MRSRIMLLADNKQSSALGEMVQEILSGIAIAFGHALLIKEEAIGASSLEMFGDSLRPDTVDKALQCDATLCLCDDSGAVKALARHLNCVLGAYVHRAPEGLSGVSLLKSDKLPHAILAYPLEPLPQARKAAENAAIVWAVREAVVLKLHSDMLPLLEQPISGNTDTIARHTGGEIRAFELSELIADCIKKPLDTGFLYLPNHVAVPMHALLQSISGVPALGYEVYSAASARLFHAFSCTAGNELNPIGAILACADLLRYALDMQREADCLLTSLQNVLTAGWRTPDMPQAELPRVGARAICNLINEQIALAGQLLQDN